jgi:hypothetical protein
VFLATSSTHATILYVNSFAYQPPPIASWSKSIATVSLLTSPCVCPQRSSALHLSSESFEIQHC